MLADAALELGDIDGAIDATQRMVDLRPDLASYGRAAWLAWMQGDPVAAHEMYRLALASGDATRDPEPMAWTAVQDALAWWAEGRLDEASAAVATAIAAMPDSAPALVVKARIDMARGHHADAAHALEEALERSPLASTAWLLADARRSVGDEAGAIAAEEQVMTLGSVDRRTLAAFLANRGRETERALELIETELKDRGGPETEDVHAWALYRAGRYSEARVAIDSARSSGLRDALLLYHDGAIHLAEGHGSEGLALLHAATALNPHFDVQSIQEIERLREGHDANPS